MGLDVILQIRCSEEEKARWTEYANDYGQSLSEWTRARLNDDKKARKRANLSHEKMASVVEYLNGLSVNGCSPETWECICKVRNDVLFRLSYSLEEIGNLDK